MTAKPLLWLALLDRIRYLYSLLERFVLKRWLCLSTTLWIEYALRRRRISRKLGRGADWARYKIAAAVWTTPTEPIFDAF